MFLTTITLLYRDNESLMCKPHDRGWLWAAETVDSLHFPSPCICVLALHFLHTFVFALCIFNTNLYLYLYLWESMVVSNRSGGFLAVFVSSLWSTLPRAHSRRSRFILPDFDFDSISYFILFFSFHPPWFWFYIFIWSTSRIESFQTLSSFLMDAMSLETRRT